MHGQMPQTTCARPDLSKLNEAGKDV